MAASDKSVAVSSTTDFSSDSTVSDGWQELTKSDYAKVIFSDLLCNPAAGTVECKFQITDNVHEDPNDYVGLFRIGYEDLSQCLVSKMLSQTKCEDDGKLQRCVFTANELPCLDDGFYQFLYVTRDQEVCGASMPFQIKMSPFQLQESSVESGSSEKMDGGFLLVSNEMERKVEEEPEEQEKLPVQRSALSEQKKEEIAAWVSQNPDYCALIEQIKEYTFTIDALQQSKDLAMKEVAQLYEILNTQNGELAQLKNMIAAYEEKIKISQHLLEEKNQHLINYDDALKASLARENQLQTKINNLKDDLEEMNRVRETEHQHITAEREQSVGYLQQINQQQTEINNLKKELEEMRELQKATESHQVTAEVVHSMEDLIQKAQDFVHIVSGTIKNIDFTDEMEVENFFQLKIQLLIMLSKMTRATELANICDRNGLHKTIHSIMEKDVKGKSCVASTSCALENSDPLLLNSNTNEHVTKNCVASTSCALENAGRLLTNSNTNVPEMEKFDSLPSSSAESSLLSDISEKEPTNEDAPNEAVQKIPAKKMFESEVLDHQIIELPRLDVINKDIAITLQTDTCLVEEDVTVMNRLTEKIVKRGSNLFEAIELVDDSSSDSESDVSEISECPSSIKKDLLCVFRVMEALSSSLSNETSMEKLVVVENDEDLNLISKKEWNLLLQKCALHYQIEILLEHIEKQKEGMKKVSDKICELLTKCMVLKDEICDSKAVCEKLQTVIDKKDMNISKLKAELEFKNSLLYHFCSEKEELESRTEIAERTVEDFHARIMEASNLYKKQYTEIGKLSKKLQKYKSVKDKTKAAKGESSMTSSESSKNTCSFEVVQINSVQNINDSDTGEHLFEKASLVSNEKSQHSKSSDFQCAASQPSLNPLDCKAPNFRNPFDNTASERRLTRSEDFHKRTDDAELKLDPERHPIPLISFNVIAPDVKYVSCNTATEEQGVKPKVIHTQIDSNEEIKTHTGNCSTLNPSDDLLPSKMDNSTARTTPDKPNTDSIECKSSQTASVFSDFASYEDFQETIKQHFANFDKPAASKNSQECSIACYFCKEIFLLGIEDPSDLTNHFEKEHLMKICPLCGQLFEDSIPPKYFHIHVDKHFETQ